MHEPVYHDATQWPEGWVDEVTFVPSRRDEAKAAEMFNPIERFEAWVEDLDDTSFVEISRALRILREAINRYRG